MPFNNYSDLKESILSWMGRPGDANVPVIDIIKLAETDLNRKLRTHYQEKSFTITTTSNVDTYQLPADFLQIKEVTILTNARFCVIDYMPSMQLDEIPITANLITMQPRYYTIEQNNIRFGPNPDLVYTFTVKYWSIIAPLTDEQTITDSSINFGGLGYTVNDVLLASGGTSTIVAEFIVDTVDGNGKILTYHISNVGNYTVLPSNPVTMIGGSGTSATFNLTFSGTSNFVLDNFPDLYLYSCLAQSEAFLGGDASDIKLLSFIKARDAAYQDINLQERKFRTGGRMVMRHDLVGAP